MKFLFVEPPLDHERTGIFPRHPPHYALFAAAHLKQAGHEVTVLDAFMEDLTTAETVERALNATPDVLILTPYDYTRETPPEISCHVAGMVKTRAPRTLIGLAGSVDKEHFRGQLKVEKCLDFAAYGEYELTIGAIGSAGPGSLATVPGLLVRTVDGIVDTGPARIVEELDALPIPAWELIDFARYTHIPHRFKRVPMYPLLATRGCPFSCLCCKEAKWAKITRFRSRSVGNVIQEIRYAVRRYQAKEIQFADATFGVNKRWVLELCEAMMRENLDLSWSAITRVDVVTPTVLRAMAEAGCWNLLYGIESVNQHALNTVDKRISIAQVKETVAATREAGIEVTASFILGLPGENLDDVLRTIDFALELDPEFAQFFVLKYYGEDGALDEWGRVDPEWDLARYDFRGPVFVPTAFKDKDELKQLQKLAYRKFYLRPAYIRRRLPDLLSPGQWPRYLKGLSTLLRLSSEK